MGKTVRNLFILMLIAASISLGVAVASAGDTVLSWPQSFSVESDEKAEFGFPVTQPGQVVIDVRWQGPALYVELRDPNGNPVASTSPAQAPPAKLTYDLTTADVQRGILWTVSISASTQASSRASSSSRAPAAARPPAPARPQSSARPQAASPASSLVISGEVSVQHPAFDQRSVDAHLRALQTQRAKATNAPLETQLLQELNNEAQTRFSAFTKARVDRLAALEKETRAKLNLGKGLTQGQRAKSTATAPGSRPGTVAVTGTTTGNSPGAAAGTTRGQTTAGTGKGRPQMGQVQDPALLSVNPFMGSPFDRVRVTVANVKPDIYAVQVWFLIGPGIWAEGNVFAATPNQDGSVEFEAEVPNAAGAGQAFQGQVYVKYMEDVPPFMTNTLPFQFTPLMGPTIDRITPAEAGVGDRVTLDGKGFKADDKVFLVTAPGKEQILTPMYQSGTRLEVGIPDYSSREPLTAQVYVRGKNSMGLWVKGNEQAITLKQNVPIVDSLSPAEAEPGTIILLAGSGFTQGNTVEFRIAGRTFLAPAEYVSETQAMVKVPDVVGVPGPVDALVCVVADNNRRSDLSTFRFKPAEELRVLALNSIQGIGSDVSFCSKDSSDSWHIEITYPTWGLGVNPAISASHYGGVFTGSRGDDEYLKNTRLINGWVVDSVIFRKYLSEDGVESDASIAETRVGTDSPYVKVHFWTSPWSYSDYLVLLVVKGPKGVPYLPGIPVDQTTSYQMP